MVEQEAGRVACLVTEQGWELNERLARRTQQDRKGQLGRQDRKGQPELPP